MLPYTASGSGSLTLIFLHYFGGSRREWKAVIRLIEDRFRSIAADAPGFGEASDIDGYTIEEMTQQVMDLTRSLAPGPCVLIGHSMMGKASMVAASRHPENLRGLALVAPSPLEPEPMTEEARVAMVQGQQSQEAARAFFLKGAKSTLAAEDILQGTEDARLANPIAWRRWPQSGTREDWSSAIPAIDIPALLLVGEHDPAIPLDFQRDKTLPHLPQGRLEVIPGVGHLLPYEALAELASQITRFVSALGYS